MGFYEQQVQKELNVWQKKMSSRPSVFDNMSKSVQDRLNRIIPEKIHNTLTTIIKQMVRSVLFGAQYVVPTEPAASSFYEKEEMIRKRIETYKKTASIEGGITGAGGILLGLAEFPVLLGIKLKLLFDIASLYGFDVRDYKERVYILQVFQLAFSSQEHRRLVYREIENWDEKAKQMPDDINAFEWRKFQQEYRDHIDLAKMAQLIPGIGAVVGLVVNYRLLKKLGDTAMNAYRMRIVDVQM